MTAARLLCKSRYTFQASIRYLMIPLWLLMTTGALMGQEDCGRCDTVYRLTSGMPEYNEGMLGLMNYLDNHLIPILSGCIVRDSIVTSSMRMVLSIDHDGNVFDVDFRGTAASKECKEELRENILTMAGWKPGIKDGQEVCASVVWPIACLLWEYGRP